MKVLLLAGGYGTRLSEETDVRPKPMVEIGGKPILWHIMKIYSHYGINDFVICLGYKGEMIKEYFANYFFHQTDFTIDLRENLIVKHANKSEPWKVTLVDTGNNTMTGGRIKRVADHIDGTFFLTYGDGVCDVNLTRLLQFHKEHKKIATVTAVKPWARFGGLKIEHGTVKSFSEKPQSGEGWINGGFFVFEPEILDLIDSDTTILERGPLETLSKKDELIAFKHNGFWQCMDTLREKQYLEKLWEEEPKWKVW